MVSDGVAETVTHTTPSWSTTLTWQPMRAFWEALRVVGVWMAVSKLMVSSSSMHGLSLGSPADWKKYVEPAPINTSPVTAYSLPIHETHRADVTFVRSQGMGAG